ncbi:MAG: glycosyltransferase family 39 protein [Planctomycetia bacterium]|nr:glycosyltransferase family 39 protein [Planctomycetia bacterium]
MTPAQLEADSPRFGRLPFLLAVSGILLLGAFFRFYKANHSLWLDELHTAWCVSGDLGDVPGRALQGNYSPVYPLLIWVWQSIAGLSELSLRTPSLLAGSLLPLAACWLLVRATGSRAAGLWAALLVALDRTFIEHSQEARANALVQLAVVVQVGVFWTLLVQPQGARRRRWLRILWVLTSALVFYLHYTGILAVAGQLGWYAWRALFRRRTEGRPDQPAEYPPRSLVVDLAALSLLCLPALPHVLDIAVRRDEFRSFVGEPKPWTPLTIFPVAEYLAVPLAAWVAAIMVSRFRGPRVEAPRAVWIFAPFLASWYLLPMLAAWPLGALFPRYVLSCAVALPLAAGWLIGSCRRVVWQALLGVAVVVAVEWRDGPIQQYLDDGTFSGHFYEDWRSAVAFIQAQDPQATLPVFLHTGMIEEARWNMTPSKSPQGIALRQYLLFPVTTRLYWLGDRPLAPLPGVPPEPDENNARLIEEHNGAWVVSRGLSLAPFMDASLASIRQQGGEVHVTEHEFHGVFVLHVRREPPGGS